jgi:hypothetical protein
MPDLNGITAEWIAQKRAENYRCTPARRVQTVEQARAFVEELGFCHFWPTQGVEMPNLFYAIAGWVRAVPDEHNDPDIGKCWGWKDDSLDKRWWYYGKLVRRRATIVALDSLPAFYACSDNFGDMEHDYLDEYRDGRLSLEEKNIYEALLENGPLDTVELRKKARLANDTAKYKFDKTLTELQAKLKVLPVGVAPVGAWRYAFIYEIVARWYPDLSDRARPISRRVAQQTLVLRYLQNVVAATRDEVYRALDVLGWTKREFEVAIGSLLEEGQLAEVQILGIEGAQLVIAAAWS